jgi:hypothetical protein
MRYVVATGLLAVIIIVCGCTSLQSATPTPAAVSATVNPPAPEATVTPAPTIAPTLSPISFAGSGDHATPIFQLQSGLSIFTMKYDGTGHFTVELKDHNGNAVGSAANALNSYDGSKALGIDSDGDYSLSVQASGPWSIVITQPRRTTGERIPLTLSGNCPVASDLIYLDSGLVTFHTSYDGTNNFMVELLDHNGRLVEVVTNRIGSYKGSQSIMISEPGIYLLNIDADGSWKLEIS